MTHDDAVNGLTVERYLLGELSGDARDQFEDHMFDCRVCAADVKDGILLLDTARTELRTPSRAGVVEIRQPTSRSRTWMWQNWVLGPALAACLALIVYQSAVVLPRMRTELAQAETPSVLAPLVLANAGARGDSLAEVVAPRHGSYVLSVDIPEVPGASGYKCSLYSPAGVLVWHVDVSPDQVRDAVTIQVPVATAKEGVNELRVQSIGASGGDQPKDVVTYRYKLSFAK